MEDIIVIKGTHLAYFASERIIALFDITSLERIPKTISVLENPKTIESIAAFRLRASVDLVPSILVAANGYDPNSSEDPDPLDVKTLMRINLCKIPGCA